MLRLDKWAIEHSEIRNVPWYFVCQAHVPTNNGIYYGNMIELTPEKLSMSPSPDLILTPLAAFLLLCLAVLSKKCKKRQEVSDLNRDYNVLMFFNVTGHHFSKM